MVEDQSPTKTEHLTDLSPYIYGTTRSGDDEIALGDRVSIARAATDGGVWFHTGHTHIDALQVLRAAFGQDRTRGNTVPGHDPVLRIDQAQRGLDPSRTNADDPVSCCRWCGASSGVQ